MSRSHIAAFIITIAAVALVEFGVDAHSYLAIPPPRPVTDAYRAKVDPQFKTAIEEAIQRAPLELFTGGSLDMNNGCRGFDFDLANKAVDITPGQKLDVLWLTQASHPGPITMHIVRPKKTDGKVKWEATEDVPLTNVGNPTTLKAPPTVNGYQGFQAVANIPTSLTGCDKPGDCALQWVLDSSAINQHYYNCADIVVKGGASTGGEANTNRATTPKPASASVLTPKPSSGTKCVRRQRLRE